MRRTLIKTVSWKLIGAADTAIIAYFVSGDMHIIGALAGFGLATSTLLYVAHEYVWSIGTKGVHHGK